MIHLVAACLLAPIAERSFRLDCSATLAGLTPGVAVRLWMPVPPTNVEQDAFLTSVTAPDEWSVAAEPRFGNRCLSTEAHARPDGTVTMSASYRVTRREARADLADRPDAPFAPFLKADKLVPVGGKASRLLDGKTLPADEMRLGRALFDAVDGYLRYDKTGEGWGRGDAEWACDSRRGNCTDFHALFIALARGKGMPAAFEIGHSLPAERGSGVVSGYHCWARFRPAGKGWVPVDISEANKHPGRRDEFFGRLDADRVTLSVGRDVVLEPPQTGPPLNYFVWPYAEADGKPVPAEKLRAEVRFTDDR